MAGIGRGYCALPAIRWAIKTGLHCLQYAEKAQSSNLQRPWSVHSKGWLPSLQSAPFFPNAQGAGLSGLPEVDFNVSHFTFEAIFQMSHSHFPSFTGSSAHQKRERAAEQDKAEKPKVRELIKQKRAKFQTANPAEGETPVRKGG